MTSGSTTVDGVAYASSGTYDALDRPLTATFPKLDPTNAAETPETLSFGYNARTLLTSVTGASSHVTGTTYDALGRALGTTHRQGV